MSEGTMPNLRNFLLAFVPIFFAMDVVGTLPLFVSLTEGMDRAAQRRVIRQSLVTALGVAVGFVFLGKWLFARLGITVSDFMVAGGVLLFVIATLELVIESSSAKRTAESVGAVPLGTPLVVGPAVLTTSLLIVPLYGLVETLLAIVVNIALAGLVFSNADGLKRVLGPAGSKAVSKVSALILAAIAVMMIRRGVEEMAAAMMKP